MPTRSVVLLGVAALGFATGCSSAGAPQLAGRSRPRGDFIRSIGRVNALALSVAVEAPGDSVHVVYWGGPDSARSTPWVRLAGDTARVLVLGLLPSTTYSLVAEVQGGGRRAWTNMAEARTGRLPPDLEGVKLTWTAGLPTAPYLLAAPDTAHHLAYDVAFDRHGRIRWYRSFHVEHGERAALVRQLKNGDFLTEIGKSSGWQPWYDEWVEFRPDGERVRTFAAPKPYHTDEHDALLQWDGDSLSAITLFGYDLHPASLAAIGGIDRTLLGRHTIFRIEKDGRVAFRWVAREHFTLGDWIEPPGIMKRWDNTDFDHPNSIALDRDGNYVVSFRNLGAVVKLDYHTGRILWQLGGRGNQFTFVGDPLGGFSGQHYVRVLDDGHLLLYDNGLRHQPPLSRVVEYALDPVRKTATMVWEFRHTPRIFTPWVGSAVRLLNGNTVIDWGWSSRLTEVSRTGQVVADGILTVDGQPVHPYRVSPIVSLYQYQRP